MSRLLLAFIVLSVTYLVVRAVDVPVWVALVTKPAPFVLLLAAIARGMAVGGRNWATVLALVFSIGGDEFLALKGVPWAFLAGLGSFLVAHLFFIAAFVGPLRLTRGRVVAALLTVPYGVALNFVLAPNVGENGPAVIAYSVVLLMMLVTTILSQGVSGRAIAGAASFALSDSLLALQLFGFAFPGGGLVSMALYDTAQWLLVTTPAADTRAA